MKFKNYLLTFMMVCASVAFAQGSKVGVVDADMVVQQSKKGQTFFQDLTTFRNQKTESIKAMVEGYQAKEKDAQAKAASLSEDKRKELAIELQRMQTDIKRAQEDAERETKLKLNEGLEKFQKELAPLIRQVALEKGLDLVMNYAAQSGIIFFSEKLDITKDVIAKYDEMAN